MIPISTAAYIATFLFLGAIFLLVSMCLGRFLRPKSPNPNKLDTYECGEKTIGSSFLQFDLRFYVVALVFIIFEVEVAFFFPWATVFGKATQLMNPNLPKTVVAEGQPTPTQLSFQATQMYRELGVERPVLPDPSADSKANSDLIENDADLLALTAMVDMSIFFVVLLVGFAYVWKQGDLDWVRAMAQNASPSGDLSGRGLPGSST